MVQGVKECLQKSLPPEWQQNTENTEYRGKRTDGD